MTYKVIRLVSPNHKAVEYLKRKKQDPTSPGSAAEYIAADLNKAEAEGWTLVGVLPDLDGGKIPYGILHKDD